MNDKRKTIGIVYDIPKQLKHSHFFQMPHDAISEWETQETIDILCTTWKEIGFNVILFPLDYNFLKRWAHEIHHCDVIHSVAEGFGSLARESWISSLCELSGIPCIGSNPFAHSLCMSKNHVKIICNKLKIPTAHFYIVHSLAEIDHIPEDFLEKTHFIKPDGEGSGMGVDAAHSLSNTKKDTIKTVAELLKLYPDGILIESYLQGPEYTTAIISSSAPQFLPIAQIEVADGVYGSANKGKDFMGEKVTFPELKPQLYHEFKHYSEMLFSYFKMSDMVRFDWKCDENGNVHFLEANTLPGLSKIYSTLPLMAAHAGIEYGELLHLLFASAYSRRNDRSLWYGQSRVLSSSESINTGL